MPLLFLPSPPSRLRRTQSPVHHLQKPPGCLRETLSPVPQPETLAPLQKDALPLVTHSQDPVHPQKQPHTLEDTLSPLTLPQKPPSHLRETRSSVPHMPHCNKRRTVTWLLEA